MAEQRTRDSDGWALEILAMLVAASGWSILFRARTVGKRVVTKVETMAETVGGSQDSRGVRRFRESRVWWMTPGVEP